MVEILSSFIEISSVDMNLATENAGCFGSGRAIDSLANITTTVDMVGLSCGFSSTHKSPICMHFTISDVEPDSIKKLSTNSITLSSFHSLHAYKFRLQMELYFIYAIPFPFLSNSNSSKQKLTYICKECLRMFSEVEATTPFPANNFKQDYTKAEDIGLNRE